MREIGTHAKLMVLADTYKALYGLQVQDMRANG